MFELLVLVGLIIVGWVVLSAIINLTFTIIGFIFLVLTWILIGWGAGQLIRGKGYGPVNDALLGLGGAILGNILLGLVGIGGSGLIWTVFGGVIGAVILVYAVRMFSDNESFAS